MPISLFGSGKRQPAQVLEEGWQLYAKPTTLEPVGTLFRIDDAGRRFMVDQVSIETQEGAEAAAKVQQRVQAHIGFFARFRACPDAHCLIVIFHCQLKTTCFCIGLSQLL